MSVLTPPKRPALLVRLWPLLFCLLVCLIGLVSNVEAAAGGGGGRGERDSVHRRWRRRETEHGGGSGDEGATEEVYALVEILPTVYVNHQQRPPPPPSSLDQEEEEEEEDDRNAQGRGRRARRDTTTTTTATATATTTFTRLATTTRLVTTTRLLTTTRLATATRVTTVFKTLAGATTTLLRTSIRTVTTTRPATTITATTTSLSAATTTATTTKTTTVASPVPTTTTTTTTQPASTVTVTDVVFVKRNLAPSGPQSPATTSYGYDDGNSVPLPRPDIPLANLNRKRATLTQRNVVISNPPRTTTTKRTLVSKSPRPPATATSTTTTTSTATTTTSTTTTRLTTPSTTTTTPAPPTTTPTSTTPTTTTSRTSTICAPRYTGGQYTITGTGTLPKPTAFVKRNGRQLQVNGQAYRPVGPNIYWLGLDENVGIAYPSKQRVREAMAIAVAMGANTIRAHTLGISVGNPLSIEPGLNTFNNAAFDIIDYALYAAREYGLRVVIPFGDQYDYYHGGKYTFLRWLGKDLSNYGNLFYTDSDTINAFETYISNILNHVNAYTGVAYKNDPTVMAWETGNEWGGYIGAQGYPPFSWTEQIAKFIKTVDGNHLVIDGTDGFWNYTTGAVAAGVYSGYVDIMSDHLYPLNNGIMTREQQIVTQYNKGFIVGEYDWTGLYGGSTTLSSFISSIESTDYMGDFLWSVFGHDDQCCKFVTHNDGYSLYYPNGNPTLTSNILQIVQHWHRMSGRTVPTSLPGVACLQKVF